MSAALRLNLLGGFSFFCDGRLVASLNTPRVQSLIAHLVLHRDVPQPRQHLAFLFWPDSTESQARTNLRHLIHQLHQTLPESADFLSADGNMIQWRSNSDFCLDVNEFESAYAAHDFVRAVQIYRGELLPECYDDWILPERERLQQMFVTSLDQLIQQKEEAGDYTVAIEHAQRLLRQDPLREDTYRSLMRLYTVQRDRASALRVYHTCSTTLQRELGVEPSPATREVYERLLSHPRAASAPSISALSAATPLIGRATEWIQLQAAWRATLMGQAGMVLISGEAGIGKTRLAEELVQWAERQGIPTASAHCYAAEGTLAYGPIKAWLQVQPLAELDPVRLSEIARLLPEVLIDHPDLSPPGPLTENWQRQRLFEALAQAMLARQQPQMLLLEDMQWCDRDTLEWVHYLLHFDPAARLLVIGTVRFEEIGPEHPVAALLNDLRRHDCFLPIELEPLTEFDTAQLAKHVAGRELEAAQLATIYRDTEGNPLFIVEMLRAQATGETRGLPPRIHAVLTTRLAQLSLAARDLISLAATIGRAFNFDLLQEASAEPEAQLVQALDELWQRRLVREHGTTDYDFSHDKIREVAYLQLSIARRRLLHHRVAEALVVLKSQDLDTFSAHIAAHYERAEENYRAAEFYRRAAGSAQQVYANQEAINLYRHALQLSGLSANHLLALYEGLGDVLVRLGQYAAAHSAFDGALQQTSQAIVQARLYHKQANCWEAQRQIAKALNAYDRAEAALQTADRYDAVWWNEWIDQRLDRISALYFANDLPRMQALVEELRPAIERYATAAQRGRFFGNLVSIGYRAERFQPSDETLTYAYTALEASRAADQADGVAYALFRVGFCHLWRNELERAEACFQAAADLDEQTGAALTRVLRLTYQTVLYRKLCQLDRVLTCAEQALNVATANNIPLYIGIAKANLAWLAWRAGRLTEVEELGCAALELMYAVASPLNWLALWPLVGVALKFDRLDEAINRTRTMLDPSQQILPAPTISTLEQAITAWERNEPLVARAYLESAFPLAMELGYL